MELRESERRGEASNFIAESERLKRELSHHLRERPMPDPDNQRLLNELGRHDDRGNLLRFLDDPGVEPTNNRAERASAWGGDSSEGISVLQDRRRS